MCGWFHCSRRRGPEKKINYVGAELKWPDLAYTLWIHQEAIVFSSKFEFLEETDCGPGSEFYFIHLFISTRIGSRKKKQARNVRERGGTAIANCRCSREARTLHSQPPKLKSKQCAWSRELAVVSVFP